MNALILFFLSCTLLVAQNIDEYSVKIDSLKVLENDYQKKLQDIREEISFLEQRQLINDNKSVISNGILGLVNKDANLKNRPSPFGDVITKIPKGEVVTIIQFLKGGYLKVLFNYSIGFISDIFIEKTDDYLEKIELLKLNSEIEKQAGVELTQIDIAKLEEERKREATKQKAIIEAEEKRIEDEKKG